MAELENILKNMDDKSLIGTLHNAYGDYLNQPTPQLKGAVSVLMKELMHRLVMPKETISTLLTSKDSNAYSEKTMTSLLSQIEDNFKKMYDDQLRVTNDLAAVAIDDYSEEYNEGKASDFHVYENFPHYNALKQEMKSGKAHEIETLYRKNFQNKYEMPISPERGIFRPAVRIVGLSMVKKSLLNEDGSEIQGWQNYRGKVCAMHSELKSLSSKNLGNTNILAEILTESSPYLQAFKDVVNNACDELGFEPFFEMSTEQKFKKVLKDITSTLGVDNPAEEEKSNKNLEI